MKEAPNTSLQEDCSFSSALERPWSTELQGKNISDFAVESESVSLLSENICFFAISKYVNSDKKIDTQKGDKMIGWTE